ncbi:MAG: ABC transporter substrate-binding protein [Nocardioides sp.]|uniref:ABC transporter substrate-binding protein n=1 Tax=Nocardioides sp. TaxID=35761 RepID=UPI003F00D39A
MNTILRRPLGALAAAAVAASLLTACGSTEESDKATSGIAAGYGVLGVEKSSAEPVRGGTLTYADVTEARSLDPTKTYATASAGGTPMAAVYDVLVRWNPESKAFEPWLAEGLEANADFTSWTLTLREGVTFSDGTPLDADAVVGSLKYFITNNGSDAPLLAQNVTSYEATDERTVVFTLNKPWSTFPNILAQGAGMVVAPAAIAGKEFTPIGAGPFTLEKYAPGEELLLAARKDYWKGEPYLEKLRFVVLQSEGATLDSLKNDEVQGALLIYSPDEQEARAEGLPGYRDLASVHPVLWINQREGTDGSDPRVRRAIALATDAELYNERVDKGEGIASTEVFADESRWASDATAPAEDLEEAEKLVAEAKADGFDGELVYLDDSDPRSQNEALVVKAMLERVGFSVKTETAASVADKMQRLYVDHDFDLATGGLAISEADPFHRLSSGLSSTSYANLTGYADEEMDGLLADLQAAGDDEARAEVVGQIEQHWYDTTPGVPLGAGSWYVTWNQKVQGVVPAAEFMMLFGEAWIGE